MVSTGSNRSVVGAVAAVGVCVFGLIASLTSIRIADEVNKKLPAANRFLSVGWYWSKTRHLHREYRRLYPGGHLLQATLVCWAAMAVCLIVCAWALGFFSA
jgi:hypothetical protein